MRILNQTHENSKIERRRKSSNPKNEERFLYDAHIRYVLVFCCGWLLVVSAVEILVQTITRTT